MRNIFNLDDSNSEDDVRYEVAKLVEQFKRPQGRLLVRQNYTVPFNAGKADIYCPGFRFVIETKAPGKATDPHKKQSGESPFEQLERYIKALRSDDLTGLDTDTDPRDWIGIVTDGEHWHGWRWRHHADAVHEEIEGLKGLPSSGSALRERLDNLVSFGPVKLPPVPQELAEHLEDWPIKLDMIHSEIMRLGVNAPIHRHTKNKFDLWLNMLRGSGMAPADPAEQARLFIKHTFLVILARCVTVILSHPTSKPIKSELALEGFVGWVRDVHSGESWVEDLLAFTAKYDWRTRRRDVLREVYHKFVEEKDRKVFGEFYTPDWLAELVVETVLDEEWIKYAVEQALRQKPELKGGIGVLDPSCGSGTFLFYAAKRLLETGLLAENTVSNTQKADVVTQLVNGIDIHPVAVEISKATLLRALPESPAEGSDALNIYQGDSLMLDGDNSGSTISETLFNTDWTAGRTKTVPLDIPEGILNLPRSFVTNPGFPTAIAELVNYAFNNREELPPHVLDYAAVRDQGCLKRVYEELKEIIAKKGNSVWAWYILNATAPLRIAERKIDRIIANPPWVRMNDIQVPERKDALIRRANDTEMWVGGIAATSFNIASLFPPAVRNYYIDIDSGFRGGWIVPSGALGGDHWSGFQTQYGKNISQGVYLDDMKPFGPGVASDCCLLLENCFLDEKEDKILSMTRVGNIKFFNRDRLKEIRNQFRLNSGQEKIPEGPSEFQVKQNNGKLKPFFRQGATILPNVLTWVDEILETGSLVKVRTIKSTKGKWKELNQQEGEIPNHWLHTLLASDQLLPFVAMQSLQAIIPTNKEGNRIIQEPHKVSKFWADLEKIYENYRGIGENTPDTLLGNMDYSGKLRKQLSVRNRLYSRRVVYNASGYIMRASRLGNTKPIINHKLYWWDAPTVDEACYLIAILNAPSLEEAFLQSQGGTGWEFDLKPWRKVPIPRFDRNNGNHVKLVGLAKRAERHALKVVEKIESPLSNRSRHSSLISQHLTKTGIYDEIDEIIWVMMPDQARESKYLESS